MIKKTHRSLQHSKLRLLIFASLVIITVGAVSVVATLRWGRGVLRSSSTAQSQEGELTQSDLEMLSELQRMIQLPDEKPVIATVVDKSKVENQEFFRHAENGDKVILFTEARKALLYRPSDRKVMNFAPLTFDQNVTP
jgi:hypothetical protein